MTNYSQNTQRQLETMHPNSTMPKGNCVSECIANQTKVYHGNGLIDRTNLARLFLNAVSGNKEWGAIVSSSIDICTKESKFQIGSRVKSERHCVILSILFKVWLKINEMKESALMKPSFEGEVICHPISGYVFGCMNTELFKRCPNMTQSDSCSALQSYSENCHISVKVKQ